MQIKKVGDRQPRNSARCKHVVELFNFSSFTLFLHCNFQQALLGTQSYASLNYSQQQVQLLQKHIEKVRDRWAVSDHDTSRVILDLSEKKQNKQKTS